MALLPRDQVMVKEKEPRVPFPLAPARLPLGCFPSHSPVLTTLKSLSRELASQSTPQMPPFQPQLPFLGGVRVLLEGPETLRLSQPCAQMFPQVTVA